MEEKNNITAAELKDKVNFSSNYFGNTNYSEEDEALLGLEPLDAPGKPINRHQQDAKEMQNIIHRSIQDIHYDFQNSGIPEALITFDRLATEISHIIRNWAIIGLIFKIIFHFCPEIEQAIPTLSAFATGCIDVLEFMFKMCFMFLASLSKGEFSTFNTNTRLELANMWHTFTEWINSLHY